MQPFDRGRPFDDRTVGAVALEIGERFVDRRGRCVAQGDDPCHRHGAGVAQATRVGALFADRTRCSHDTRWKRDVYSLADAARSAAPAHASRVRCIELAIGDED